MANDASLSTFDMGEYLKRPNMTAHLSHIINVSNAAEFTFALGIIARVRGMSGIASASGLTREALF